MTQPSGVAIGLSSIMGGASAGTAIGTIGAWVANWMNLNGMTPFGDPRNVYFAGICLGIVAALALAWTMSTGLKETWRRAAMAVTASFGAIAGGAGAFGLSMFSIMMFNPLAQYFVPAYLLLFIAIFMVCWRVSTRQRQTATATATSHAA